MGFWPFFVGAGAFACCLMIIGLMRPTVIIRTAQDFKREPWAIVGRMLFVLVLYFVLGGAVLGTPIWFFADLLS